MTNYDKLETREIGVRDTEQLIALNEQIAYARKNTKYFAKSLKHVDAITNLDALEKLPLIRKSALIEAQNKSDPFAGMNAKAVNNLKNLFLSPGPIAEPMGQAANEHRLARAMAAMGINEQDRVLNCFSYHHTPAGLMFESGASKIGCPVYPGGIGQRDDQIQAIGHFSLTAYVGTPDFLKLIIEKAKQDGIDVSTITKAMVTGGPFFPELKHFYADHNINAKECYATADLGLIAYQDEHSGLVIDEDVIVEIVTPGTGNRVADGQVGEVVVTLLTNKTYPLIRFATGDLSAILTEKQPSRRSNKRLKGWLGRADQTCKVKGMFVHPEQVAKIVSKHEEVVKARLVVEQNSGQDNAVLQLELLQEMDHSLIAESAKNICKISVNVIAFEVGNLPNDGLIIEDKRDYS